MTPWSWSSRACCTNAASRVRRSNGWRFFLRLGAGATAGVDALVDFLECRTRGIAGGSCLKNAFGGKLAQAQAGLRRAAAEGEGGPAAVRALSSHAARIRRTPSALRKPGADSGGAAKAAGVFWRNEREFLRQARAWTLPHLDRLQPDLLEADRACKQTGSPDRLIAERLAMTIAGRARRLGL